MPRHGCGRCGNEKVSNVTVEVQGRGYRLCEECFREYLKVDAADDRKQVEFIRGSPPNELLGKLKYLIRRAWLWIIKE